MIHLPPLLSLDGFPGLNTCIDKALKDLEVLQSAGYDGALLENENDKPHTENVNQAQIASMSIIAWEVMKKAKIPVGVQLLLNDWKSSFDVAKAVGAQFTRLDVFVDDVSCKWCDIFPKPQEIMDYKNSFYPELTLFTDIQVKYKTMFDKNKTLQQSAQECIDYGSDGIVITGTATGVETPMEKIKTIRESFPDATLLVGAGINKDNILEQFKYVNGAIVGSSIKTGEYVDYNKAKELVELIKN